MNQIYSTICRWFLFAFILGVTAPKSVAQTDLPDSEGLSPGYKTAISIQPLQFVRARAGLGITRALNSSFAFRGDVYFSKWNELPVLVDELFFFDRQIRYMHTQSLELQGRYFPGKAVVGRGFFIGPMVRFSRIYGLTKEFDFSLQLPADKLHHLRAFGTGFVIGTEMTTRGGMFYDFHFATGLRMVNRISGDEDELPEVLVLDASAYFARIGFSMGWGHDHSSLVPPSKSLKNKEYDKIPRNALLIDPLRIFAKGLRLSYLRAIRSDAALVATSGYIIQNEMDLYKPFDMDHVKRTSYGLAVRKYFNEPVLVGPYFSLGYNYNHTELRLREPRFGLNHLDEFISVTRLMDDHELELMLGYNGGTDVIYFDLAIKQGFRFSENMHNDEVFLFKSGMYIHFQTGLGIRF